MDTDVLAKAIKGVLETVPGIGVVHDAPQYTKSTAQWLKMMTPEGSKEVNGWCVTGPGSSPVEGAGLTNVDARYDHSFLIVGVHEINEASMAAFRTMISNILITLIKNQTLGTLCIPNNHLPEATEIDEIPNDEDIKHPTFYHTVGIGFTVTSRTIIT